MSKSPCFSFSSLRQNFSKQGGISRSTKQEQAAPWNKKHQLHFQRGEESKALSLPGIPVSQRNSTELYFEKTRKHSKLRGFFLPSGKTGCCILCLIENPSNRKLDVLSVPYKSLLSSLSCCSPATGRADLCFPG